jgi:hypothetical protein
MTTTTLISRQLLVLTGLLAWSTLRAETCVTLLADLGGNVTVANVAAPKPEDRWPVQLLQCFVPRKVLSLDSGARATLFFPAEGVALELRGPGRFEVMPSTVRPLASAPVPSRVLLTSAFRDVKLDRSNLTPAGVRMRDPRFSEGLALLEPRGIVTSAGELVFRWQAASGATRYRFRLAAGRKDVIYETLTEKTEFVVPPEIRLAAGERLLWQAEDGAGAATSRWQEFVLATPEARSLAEALDREAPSPSAAERNLRDLLLMQVMLRSKSEP